MRAGPQPHSSGISGARLPSKKSVHKASEREVPGCPPYYSSLAEQLLLGWQAPSLCPQKSTPTTSGSFLCSLHLLLFPISWSRASEKQRKDSFSLSWGMAYICRVKVKASFKGWRSCIRLWARQLPLPLLCLGRTSKNEFSCQ